MGHPSPRRKSYTGPRLALFLGAGASVSSGLPRYEGLMAAVGRAVEAAPLSTSSDEFPRLAELLTLADSPAGPGRLKVLGDVMVTNAGPAVPHMVAQALLACGDPVLSVNWDDLVEQACEQAGTRYHLILPGDETRCDCGLGHLFKLHGEPHRRPPADGYFDRMPAEWAPLLESLMAERDVAVFGHSARDADIRPALFCALNGVRSCDWFCLPEDKPSLLDNLGPLADSGPVTIHGSTESFPQLLAWASAHGVDVRSYETEQASYAAAAALITPRMMGLVDIVARRPLDLQVMDDRAFEELIAALLQEEGFEVDLTQRSKDGGVDIHVRGADPVADTSYYLLQCKRVGPGRKVGPAPLRELYGLVSATSGATKGIVVTSGFYTAGAKAFQEQNRWRLALHDYDSLSRWVERVHTQRAVS